MPQVVLMAKSTYVWLDQLSRSHGRDIRTLDAIPDEELDTLAAWGVTGLWLIGLWERSKASERIKRMRGNAGAVASAYSLDDYRIADDLGGEAAYANLRDRAWSRGIRLASDMVPNHMGIDSRWVIDHPEWFLSLPEPPYPGLHASPAPTCRPTLASGSSSRTTTGTTATPRSSSSGSTARPATSATSTTATTARASRGTTRPSSTSSRRRSASRSSGRSSTSPGASRSSGSTPPWSSPRSTSSACGGRSPAPADGIPSRAEHAISKAEFDARMPVEFWREVVDRVAAEVPGTLLLAEAFWMLEGYFVRTLGMHRVYNSAFMHMLRDENGAGYRQVMRETLEFDPEILKRYVNFMSNPDEETALEQFGKGDKYFGVAMVMATLPGLPMLGHGQVQGFGEKYGMEFRRATLDEQPDPWLARAARARDLPAPPPAGVVRRGARLPAVRLRDRRRRATSTSSPTRTGAGRTRSLVLYHDAVRDDDAGRSASRRRTPSRRPTARRRLVRRSLAEGLGLPNDPAAFVAFRDARTGLEYLRSCRELRERGLGLTARGLRRPRVLGVPRGLGRRRRPVGQARRAAGRERRAVARRRVPRAPARAGPRARCGRSSPTARSARSWMATARPAQVEDLERRFATFLAAVADATGRDRRSGRGGDRRFAARLARTFAEPSLDRGPGPTRPRRAARSGWRCRGWASSRRARTSRPRAGPGTTNCACPGPSRPACATPVSTRPTAWAAADLVRVLLTAAPPVDPGRPGPRPRTPGCSTRWLAATPVRAAIGLNTWEGVEWLDRERFEGVLRWAVRLDAIDALPEAAPPAAWPGSRGAPRGCGGGGRLSCRPNPRDARAAAAGEAAASAEDDEPMTSWAAIALAVAATS